MDTLVLSIDYRPLRQVSAAEAIAELLKGRAEVVESYEDRYVVGCENVWTMPSIIRFITKASGWGFRKGVKFSRQNIWIRDKGRCGYCGVKVTRSEFTYDHVIPRAQGGKTIWENIVGCCIPCNQHKRARTPEQARMTLLHKPYKPKVLPGVTTECLSWSETMPDSWKQFVTDVGYWHGKLEEESG